jgi:hypothetical protein
MKIIKKNLDQLIKKSLKHFLFEFLRLLFIEEDNY